MKAYLLSLGLGIAVGLIYNVAGVRSPAPPTIALVGLLGMLAGEHGLAMLKTCFTHLSL
jgi:XapX domain-containing protein